MMTSTTISSIKVKPDSRWRAREQARSESAQRAEGAVFINEKRRSGRLKQGGNAPETGKKTDKKRAGNKPEIRRKRSRKRAVDRRRAGRPQECAQ